MLAVATTSVSGWRDCVLGFLFLCLFIFSFFFLVCDKIYVSVSVFIGSSSYAYRCKAPSSSPSLYRRMCEYVFITKCVSCRALCRYVCVCLGVFVCVGDLFINTINLSPYFGFFEIVFRRSRCLSLHRNVYLTEARTIVSCHLYLHLPLHLLSNGKITAFL